MSATRFLARRIFFIHRRTEFLGPAYYASMGFAVPAAMGAQLANPTLRPLVIVGDGAFQMTGMEVSTAARHNLNPIIVVLNNSGFGTERHIHDGPYNDILPWEYAKIPELLGTGRGFVAVRKMNSIRHCALQRRNHPVLHHRRKLDPMDRSPALERLAERLSKKI